MTLTTRNHFFKVGILAALGALALMVGLAFLILPIYPQLMSLASRRAFGLLQTPAGQLLQPSPYVPFISMILAVTYALVTMILIYYFFEKTQTLEILFFAFFVLSFIFEAARLMVPLGAIYELPSVYLVFASRVLLFGRYFGVFSLFAAGIYASGLEMQKQGNVIFIIAVITLIITLGIPIDGMSWDSSLSMISGYTFMFKLVETGIILMTMISFFISAYSRGTREYVFIGIGAILVYIGKGMLIEADTWLIPFPGLLILTAGTWFICNQLHKVYLWL